MLITAPNLAGMFAGFKTSFNKGFKGVESTYLKIAMKTNSATGEEAYGWLKELPQLREWIGSRIIHNLEVAGYTIKNRTFEVTIGVPRTAIEDDQYGVFGPLYEKMGADAAKHPDQLVYELLAAGFTELCYDGKPFFSTDHVVDIDCQPTSYSNYQDGAGPAWFLMDAGQPVKPLVFQERLPYEFQRQDAATDDNVFWKDEYFYGVRARANAGFGLWQLAYASKAPLTHDNYEAARVAIKSIRGENGKKLGLTPNILVVPDELEGDGLRLIKNNMKLVTVGTAPNEQTVAAPNEWAGTAELVVSPYL
ncbi:MAG TPA: Mu-like prophage major head subunit gpT family protein [Azospirillum sp.]|nr:Mu-like prophage major head subunit gpT family protein [Azospirillum sp.]